MKSLHDITVKGVKALINRGRFAQAHRAIDRLLALGPNNLAMLKLKGLVLAQEGRFEEEAALWLRIMDLYDDDPDAFEFFQQLDYEERLNFYFSDYLPNGGRRFLTQPQSVLNASLLGVLGCLLFLLVHSWGLSYRLLAEPVVSVLLFVVLVLLPWLGIFVVFLSSLREVTLTREGIHFATKLRRLSLRWDEIAAIYMVHAVSPYSSSLAMVIQPRNRKQARIELDLNADTSPIRARSFFVREVFRHFPKPQYIDRSECLASPLKAASF